MAFYGIILIASICLYATGQPTPTGQPSSTPSTAPSALPTRAEIAFQIPFITSEIIGWLIIAAYVCGGCCVANCLGHWLYFKFRRKRPSQSQSTSRSSVVAVTSDDISNSSSISTKQMPVKIPPTSQPPAYPILGRPDQLLTPRLKPASEAAHDLELGDSPEEITILTDPENGKKVGTLSSLRMWLIPAKQFHVSEVTSSEIKVYAHTEELKESEDGQKLLDIETESEEFIEETAASFVHYLEGEVLEEIPAEHSDAMQCIVEPLPEVEEDDAAECISPPTMKIDEKYPPIEEEAAREPDPPIYFLSLDFLRRCGTIPRFPATSRGEKEDRELRNSNGLFEAKKCTRKLRDGLIVYVSHDWIYNAQIETKFETEGRDSTDHLETQAFIGPVHPLAHHREHYSLLLTALDGIKENYCNVKSLYIWLDFSCTPLDLVVHENRAYNSSPALKMLDRIMEKCDVMLTVVHENEQEVTWWTGDVSKSGGNMFQDYHAPPFQRYLKRRWARVEMLFASLVPLPTDDESPHKNSSDEKLRNEAVISISESSGSPPLSRQPTAYKSDDGPVVADATLSKLYDAPEFAHTLKCRLNPLRPSITKSVSRIERLKGGVEFEAIFARRAHLLYGRREYLMGKPPLVLPLISDSLRDNHYNPLFLNGKDTEKEVDEDFEFPDNLHFIQEAMIRLMPFQIKGAAGYVGDKVNAGTISAPLWLRHGLGTQKWPNGNMYIGTWVNDGMEGNGAFSSTVGWYNGELRFGCQHGYGKFVAANGNMYEGSWIKGKRHGLGTFTWSSGANFEGTWIEDEIGQFGTFTAASGSVYRGEFENGMRSGTGSMLWVTGERYVGSWQNGMRHGLGFHRVGTASDDSKGVYRAYTMFTGQFNSGHKYGAGSLTLKDHSTLHGVFIMDNVIRLRSIWEEQGSAEPQHGEWVEQMIDPSREGNGTNEEEDELDEGGIEDEFALHFGGKNSF